MKTIPGALAIVLSLSCLVANERAALAQSPVSNTPPSPAAREPDVGSMRDARRVAKVATIGALGATAGLGLVLALNKPTAFGDGRCESGGPIFGSYGCDQLPIVHGMGAIGVVAGYTASTTLDFTTPRPPPKAPALHRVLTVVHVAGVLTAPLLGLVSAYPEVVGLDDSDDLQRGLRTAHMGTAIVTAAAFTTTVALDW